MKNLILTAALLFASSSNGYAQTCDHAESLVSSLKPSEQFKSMLRATVQRTQTYAMASVRNPSGARERLDSAIEIATRRHAAEWERNLVASWNTLPAIDLKNACAALRERNNVAFMRFAQRVGPMVQTRNEPLLKKAAAEVLGDL